MRRLAHQPHFVPGFGSRLTADSADALPSGVSWVASVTRRTIRTPTAFLDGDLIITIPYSDNLRDRATAENTVAGNRLPILVGYLDRMRRRSSTELGAASVSRCAGFQFRNKRRKPRISAKSPPSDVPVAAMSASSSAPF